VYSRSTIASVPVLRRLDSFCFARSDSNALERNILAAPGN
jgi:hypothetical protein